MRIENSNVTVHSTHKGTSLLIQIYLNKISKVSFIDILLTIFFVVFSIEGRIL
jgi:hypothetical protein